MAAGEPYFNCNNKLDFEQLFKALIYADANGNPALKIGETTMLPYFNCDNTNLSIDQVFRKMIIQDSNGNPTINVTS